jgi:alpha,alpha-trehalase
MATGVISASENCREVLEAAKVADLFDVRVDGVDAERLALPGKPEPDIFLEAARRLGVSPRRAVVVEDALAGVEAGRRGGFALVIGVDRAGQADRLARFADVVVADLKEITMEEDSARILTDDLPLALEHVKEMGDRLRNKQVVVFIDYDGTLTPIVERPELAKLSEEMRQALRDLAEKCTLAIVSGRDLADVRDLVSIDGIFYAGSHGFDISGPEGHMEYQQGRNFLPSLDRAEQALRRRLENISGCQVERKRFAIAVHFRRVADGQVPNVEAAVDEVLAACEDLRKTGGKKIFELRPDIEWDKGKAITWILQQLGLDRKDVLPFYLGDDLTDEDAFRELRQRGITVLVRDESRPTLAHYAVENPEEVRLFLHMLATLL